MKSSEEAIDKVMAGLRDAKALPGLERRILEAVDGRVSVRSQSGWHRWRPGSPGRLAGASAGRSFAWGVAAAGVLTVAVVIPSTYRIRHAPAPSGVRPAGAVSQPPVDASGLIATSPQLLLPASNARRMRRSGAKKTRLVDNKDSAAVHDTFAISHPAPPMPLTEQERLLLRIAHAGDPVELAMLNPEVRARREAQSEAEFKEFFPPPPPIKEKADDHL